MYSILCCITLSIKAHKTVFDSMEDDAHLNFFNVETKEVHMYSGTIITLRQRASTI